MNVQARVILTRCFCRVDSDVVGVTVIANTTLNITLQQGPISLSIEGGGKVCTG